MRSRFLIITDGASGGGDDDAASAHDGTHNSHSDGGVSSTQDDTQHIRQYLRQNEVRWSVVV